MNKIIALLILLILLYFNFIKYEFFQDSTTTASESSNSTTSSQGTNAASGDSPSLSYFELSNADKNVINRVEREKEILNIEKEEQKMKNNVRKIADEAKNVLAYTDLNMQYFKDIKFNNEQNEQENPVNSPE